MTNSTPRTSTRRRAAGRTAATPTRRRPASFTLGAAAFGLVACKVPGQPEPRPPYTEDADKPDYQCGYDGNQRCPTTPPPVRASCDEPAAWCHRGAAAEAVQR